MPAQRYDTVMKTGEPWAVKLRHQRNIGDFRRWKEHDRVLRDLKAAPG